MFRGDKEIKFELGKRITGNHLPAHEKGEREKEQRRTTNHGPPRFRVSKRIFWPDERGSWREGESERGFYANEGPLDQIATVYQGEASRRKGTKRGNQGT